MSHTSKINPKLIKTRLLPKRIDKTLDWLEASRDVWKDKCLTAKLALKMKTLSIKRLRDSRDKWKNQTKQFAITIQQIQNERENYIKEIENLKRDLIKKSSEIENLKKKSSSLLKN